MPPATVGRLRRDGSYCATGGQIPWTLAGIGRLREWTFERSARAPAARPRTSTCTTTTTSTCSSGTPKSAKSSRAYRLGRSDVIRKRLGARGLYLNSLFEFREPFFTLLGPSLELGRSFVRPEYQRSYAPLLLLWKGISEYIGRYPAYARLIGAASVSNTYDPMSRALLVEALRAWRSEPLLGPGQRAPAIQAQPFVALAFLVKQGWVPTSKRSAP